MSQEAVARVAAALVDDGLNLGSAGNVSARSGEVVWITPSGLTPAAMTAEDIVGVGLDGAVVSGALRPSSEWPFHCAVYRARRDVAAIVHAHSPWASAVACAGREIPPFHYMVAGVGGDRVRCAPYAPPGSDELARGVVDALGNHRACLLANHGVIAVGATVDAAYEMLREVELLAQQFALSHLVGGPQLLEEGEMNTLREIFAHYGQETP